MAAVQGLEVVRSTGLTAKKKSYTSYEQINELLNRFTEKSESLGVWVSVEGDGIREIPDPDALCEVIGLALEAAFENCCESTMPKNRYIKIRSRDVHNQVFVKVEYPCENGQLKEFGKSIIKMQKQIDSMDGYLKVCLVGESGNIRIAVPK